MLFPTQLVLEPSDPPEIIEHSEINYPPYRFEGLNINGERFDLRNPQDVERGLEQVKEYRKLLNSDQLDKYDDKNTKRFGGGRSNLRYDEIRLKMADDYHQGKHSMSFDQQHSETKRCQEYEELKWKKQ